MAHTRACLLCVTVLACSGESAAPGRTPRASAAATALARTFAPEIVGKLVSGPPQAGDYAMALQMRFDTYPSMEMHISRSRAGALRLSLAADGTARACLGARDHEAVSGQYHYEPPGRRQHHASEDARLLALGGRWKVVDDVAAIQFDRLSWSTCDLAGASQLDRPLTELRCVGVAPTERVPEGGLACEAGEASQLLELGMPMTAASRKVPPGPMSTAPAGRSLLLGAPGLLVEVRQGARDAAPSFTFTKGAVTMVEADYRRKGKGP